MSLLKLPVELLLQVSSYLEFVFDLGSLYQRHSLLHTLLKDRVDELLKMEQSLQPLAWAASNGKERCVRKLLDAGALFEDSGDWTTQWDDPMTISAEHGHVDIVRMFLDHGRDPTPAIKEENSRFFAFDFNHLAFFGTPFFAAVLEGHTSVVSFLIERGSIKRCMETEEKREWCDLSLCFAVRRGIFLSSNFCLNEVVILILRVLARPLCIMLPQLLLQARLWKSSVF
ncbi:unnamed protein product [Penicillium egyptiacum]|uniref:F-box domain-containing protein n=1 Tax=Penicillium egyptiacum TaxID=1303716 RepID=A0A9W4P1T1_9EURO|nr:unnamed protein product [Penicillium egyptiacum]